MRYKKPSTVMAICVCVTVLMCSCGIVSEPKEVKLPEKAKEVYVEQTVSKAIMENITQNCVGYVF
nr:hypothetical protein [Eubacterium sp.]